MNQRRTALSTDLIRDADPSADPRAAAYWGGAYAQDYGAAMPHAGAHGPDHQVGFFKMVHKLLRGRYAITIIAALVFAVAGAGAGWLSTKPRFQTVGKLQIKARMPKIDPNSPFAQQTDIWNVDRFAMTQAALIQSERVLAFAAKSDAWRNAGFEADPEFEDHLRESLDVRMSRMTPEILEVAVTDKSPEFTRIAVKEIIDAYMEINARDSIGMEDAVLAKLEERRSKSEGELARIRHEIDEIAKDYGTEDLTRDYELRQADVTDLRRRVGEMERVLLDNGVLAPPPKEGGPDKEPAKPNDPPIPMTAREIAAVDVTMQEYLQEEQKLSSEIEKLVARGFSREHPKVRSDQNELDGLRTVISNYVAQWNKGPRVPGPNPAPAGGPNGALPGGVGAVRETPEMLKQRYDRTKAQLEKAKAEMVEIGNKHRTLAGLQEQVKMEKRALDATLQQIEELRAQTSLSAQTGGRIQKLTYGTTPNYPTVDSRKKMAAAGFVLGGGLPIALMLMLGLLDRRFRYSEDAIDAGGGGAPLLGILPVLPKDLDDEEQRSAAAHCVHQIRLLLQMNAGTGAGGVFAMTSPTSGDGKTSLTLSLGLSFAASGSRTLLVDFDTVGTGLSASLDVRGAHGVVEAIRAGGANGHVHKTQVPGLYLLPSAAGDEHHVTRMSTVRVREFVDRLRDEYDVVLIDTGPILGSLEASMVAGCVDGVVLVVGRGQHHQYVKKAIEQVASVGGKLAGLVFNRATGSDFRRSISSASIRTQPRMLPGGKSAPPPAKRRLAKAGPVAQSIVLDIDADAAPGHESEELNDDQARRTPA